MILCSLSPRLWCIGEMTDKMWQSIFGGNWTEGQLPQKNRDLYDVEPTLRQIWARLCQFVYMQLTYWVMPWSIGNMHFSYTIYDYFVYPDYTLRVCKANMHWYGECSLIMYTVCVRYRKYCKRIFGCFQLPLLVPISWDLSLFGHGLMKWARDPSTWSSDFTLPHWTCSFVCNFNTIESIQSCSHFGALNLSCTLPSLSY